MTPIWSNRLARAAAALTDDTTPHKVGDLRAALDADVRSRAREYTRIAVATAFTRAQVCQSARKVDPGSASNIDPHGLRERVVPVVHRRDPRPAPRPATGAGGGGRGRFLWAHRGNPRGVAVRRLRGS